MSEPARGARLAPDERQQQILLAAAELFRTRNVAELSTSEIAQAAGVSRGLLNHYFRTKRDLYLAVVRSFVEVPPAPPPSRYRGLTLEQRVAQGVEDWLDLVESRAPLWLSALSTSWFGQDEEVAAILDEATDVVVDRVLAVAGVGRAAARRQDLRAAVRAYGGFASALSSEWLQEGRLERAQVQVLLEGVLTTLLRDLLPRLRQ